MKVDLGELLVMADLEKKMTNALITVNLMEHFNDYYVKVHVLSGDRRGILYHKCWDRDKTRAREDYEDKCADWGLTT